MFFSLWLRNYFGAGSLEEELLYFFILVSGALERKLQEKKGRRKREREKEEGKRKGKIFPQS